MQRKEIEKVYIKKIKELTKYDKAYFKHDRPLIFDRDYDILKKEMGLIRKKIKSLFE